MPLNDATLPNVIADVGETLRQILRDQIDDLALQDRVVFSSPADMDATTDPRVGLFLYQVLETTAMRNYPPEADDSLGARRYQTVDLFYLLTPYTQDLEDSHRLLGRVMRTFFDHSVLEGSILQGSLADVAEPLRVLLQPITMEEVNQLWGLFPNKPYRLSITYQVTPVKIFGGLATPSARVTTRDLNYAQITQR